MGGTEQHNEGERQNEKKLVYFLLTHLHLARLTPKSKIQRVYMLDVVLHYYKNKKKQTRKTFVQVVTYRLKMQPFSMMFLS